MFSRPNLGLTIWQLSPINRNGYTTTGMADLVRLLGAATVVGVAAGTLMIAAADDGGGSHPMPLTAAQTHEIYLAARRCHHGENGTPRDLERAMYLYRYAANAGNIGGITGVGILYKTGWNGVAPDYDAAAHWLGRAASSEQGSGAMFHLAELYELGLGVPLDFDQARSLYQAAAARGVERAGAALRRLRPNELQARLADLRAVPVRAWSEGDVGRWLTLVSLGHLRPAFQTNRIDGEVLVALTPELLAEMQIPVGDRLRLRQRLADFGIVLPDTLAAAPRPPPPAYADPSATELEDRDAPAAGTTPRSQSSGALVQAQVINTGDVAVTIGTVNVYHP